MHIGLGLTVTQRVRMSARDVHHAGGVCDGARVLELFADVASELLVRLDGDEGRFRSYDAVEFLSPVRAGDVLEVTGVISAIGATSRTMAFEARKVVKHLGGSETPSAADALSEPIAVCRAIGTSIVPTELQRRPRIVLPALGAHARSDMASLPEPHVVITPPPHILLTPPNTELILTASLFVAATRQGGALPGAREVAAEAARCREAGASVIEIRASDADSARAADLLNEAIDVVRRETDLAIAVSTSGPPGASSELRARPLAHTPDVAALDCGSCNQEHRILATPRPMMRDLAVRIARAGAAIELTCHDLGHIHEALVLASEGLVPAPLRFRLVVGAPGAAPATEQVVRFLVSQIPAPAPWGIAAPLPHQRAMTELATRLGGHLRVGPEGETDLASGAYAEGTAPFVRRAAEHARAAGREIVEPARARTLLGSRAPLT